ncbi:hypothetical protein Tco_0471411 [Tanacetum coccineum]
MGKTCVSGRFARLQEVRFNFDQKDQETPRIVGDDSARSEPMEVADSNNFKPLLKEKIWKVLRISKETEIKNNTQGEKQRDSVVYREKKGRKNTLAKEYGEELCGTAVTRHKGRKGNVLTLERIAWYRKEEASEKGLLLNAT